jgi:hypothetical protein
MARVIGNILFVVIALVVIAVVGVVALALFGTLVGLLGLAIKLALVAGVIYFIWLVFKKLVHES